MSSWRDVFEKIDDFRWKIKKSYKEGMRVDAVIYANDAMLEHIFADNAHVQVVNVACLPGIIGNSLAMPDIHLGYGFAIGGVAAFDPDAGGIISPGGVGYDINCGVRVLRTGLKHSDIQPKIKDIVYKMASDIPSGVGSKGAIKLSEKEMNNVLVDGAKWAVGQGYGEPSDFKHTEEEGAMPGADPEAVSERAKERGFPQVGTLGSGNHFAEVQVVDEIFDEDMASTFGLEKDAITIMVHSGSRGLGHQVCTDFISTMRRAAAKYNITLPDQQLCCAPINSPEGKEYFGAMAAAANFAWANRQMLMHWTIEAFGKALGGSRKSLGISLIYDVAHNIAKMEKHKVAGKEKLLCVHRKGATRAFPAGRVEIPEDYRETGQPVLIPGDMGRYSFILVGTERAMQETWGSVCHGAGRLMSRAAATRNFNVDELLSELESKGIIVRSASRKGLIEEAPGAYKDVREVVDVVSGAGLAKKVARMRPLGVIKG
ncbi:MAG: RtcB family protein [Candidatus Saganbacteria bacterium]|nr:RtcB family protein [Candidatus Saganbacteria bacterium]